MHVLVTLELPIMLVLKLFDFSELSIMCVVLEMLV